MPTANNLTSIDWWSIVLYAYLVHPFIMIMLCLLSVLVVLGNLLVVSAIWHENQLHSVTNYLIASLAAADCLVGAVVMPSSIISDIIIGSWTFGANWCDLWHSFDVLASTASIMNLCAISYDRYLAITDPISYPTRMTPKIVAFIIVSLWTCSSLISFPAILWWRAVGKGSSVREIPPPALTATTLISRNEEISPMLNASTTTLSTQLSPPVYKCEFTDDTYYLLFSSSVSFYIPLCVMLYAYYRIYKAAIQQTRFLKHGSKQVIIGRRKKSKRSRHVSEHSAFIDRAGANSLLYSEKQSSMENYDRQHLVLRAHRGGGGGTTNKTYGIESTSGKSPMNQRRLKDLHHESVKSKSNLNIEPDPNAMASAQSLKELDQSTQCRNNIAFQANKPMSAYDQGSTGINRIDSLSARRDKMKVESQRFDPKPNQIQDSNIHHVQSEIIEHGSKIQTAHEPPEKLTKIDDVGPKSNNCEADQIGWSSMVTINNRCKASVDVSIIECPDPVTSITDKELSLNGDPLRLENQQKGMNQAHLQNNTPGINQNENTSNRNNMGTDEDASDEIAETESNSSSGSYGTGSIISVMVRPQQTQQQAMHGVSAIEDERRESNSSPAGNFMLKRALSYKESKRKISTPKLRIEETQYEAALKVSQQSHKRHRASYGDQSSTSNDFDAISNLKTSKTLNIRSLVKLTRAHANKNKNNHGSSKSNIKPPPSLLPLMSMNSDTSTDSSIARSSIGGSRQTISKSRDSCRKVNDKLTIEARGEESFKSEQVNDYDSNRNNNRIPVEDRNNNSKINQGNLENKNSSFKSDLERGEARIPSNKGQILYYDSDKLIQSIVDLTDIHYIDCANIKDIKNNGEPVARSSGQLLRDTQRTDLNETDQVRISEGLKANIPRQHRGMGKKLSKLAKERKAAKTLGIVVGVFILCWLPFFVMNILVALCGTNCIYEPQVFGPVFTWLGWLNSAMNPVIYACWSRDFRRAFRRVLCAWVEFVCPYDGSYLARKLRLKKSVHNEQYLSRTVSSIKGNTSTGTTRSGLSIDRRGCNSQLSMNGSVSRSLLSDQ